MSNLCLSWLYEGSCSTSNCTKDHGPYEKNIESLPISDDKEKTVLCRRWIDGNCTFQDCHFAHGLLNIKYNKYSSCKEEKNSLCSRWICYGYCDYTACKFAHGLNDLTREMGFEVVPKQSLCLKWLMRSCNNRNCPEMHRIIGAFPKATAKVTKSLRQGSEPPPSTSSASPSASPSASASASASPSSPSMKNAWGKSSGPPPPSSAGASPNASSSPNLPPQSANPIILSPASAVITPVASSPAPVLPSAATAAPALNPIPAPALARPLNQPFQGGMTYSSPPGFPINPMAIPPSNYVPVSEPNSFNQRARERHDSTARHDASALYRDMHVSLCKLIRTLAPLLPQKIGQLCEQLVIPNNPLSRDLDEIAAKIAKIAEVLLQQLCDELKGDAPRVTGSINCRDFLHSKMREDARHQFFFRSVAAFSIPSNENRIPDPMILYDSLDSLRYLVELYCAKEDHFQYQSALPPPYDNHRRGF